MIHPAKSADLPALADLWHQGWHEAHAAFVPAALKALRNRDSLFTRLQSMSDVYTAGPSDAPLGLLAINGNEIYQFYVSPAARGTGIARKLITYGEAQIRAAGHKTARLDVLPENPRAIAFYEKSGWRKQGVEIAMLDTLAEPFPLPCLVMTKKLG